MKAMVTGGAGFIGSHIVDALVDAGAQVCVVDSLWEKGGGKVENVSAEASFYMVDICSTSLVDVFMRERPDIVYHQAAQHSVKISTDEPVLDAQVNVLGLVNLLRCCTEYGAKKIVFASTCATYGPVETLPVTEQTPQMPSCPYGITKMAAEHYLRYWRQRYGLNYTVFRYPNAYGPRQDATGEAGVIAIFAQKILNGETVKINWDGKQTRDFVYVGDLARANLLASTAGNDRIYCLGSGVGTPVDEIYARLVEIVGRNPGTIPAPKTPGDQRHSRIDASKAERELGWTAQVSLNEGLIKTVDFFKARMGRKQRL
jgi:UDP-glucose 4-epimerase